MMGWIMAEFYSLFFFSSRRRHTRSLCDWSSDVCSSDLGPRLRDCSADTCPSKWAHSKGLLAWNQDGEGMILQVTTPAWPESASHDFPRKGDRKSVVRERV